MTAALAFNPYVTTNGAGLFGVDAVGYIQGTAMDDPSARNWLSGGVLATSETIPMWGGVAISETTTPNTGALAPSGVLGGIITRATGVSTVGAAGSITGFSVFDQAHSMVNSPQSPVPLAASGNLVNFYRFGTNARIPVACSADMVNAEGVIVTQQVSWDYTAQMLIPYSVTYAADTISNAVWANTAGGQVTYTVGTDLTADINAGDIIEVSGVVNTGGTGTGIFNGQYQVVSIDATHIVVVYLAAASPGTYASGGSVLAGGGILPIRVLDVKIGNCMTVVYNPTTGFATWNYNGNCALILI